MPSPSACEGAPAVEIAGLSQSYGTATILDGIDLVLPVGHVLALLGPSGCGKTTLLRLTAGLATPTKGTIHLAGTPVADATKGLFVPPERRGLGMVFQDYALWPHLGVGANVSFPLEMRKVPRSERETRVRTALERVGLGGFEARAISSLSGGQQQRVAIARAIVAEPSLVLFDEPLSNLDRELREELGGELAALLRRLKLTAIYVTHDQSEAFALADTVAVMRGGRIVQRAAPEEIVEHPADPAVSDLLNLGPTVEVERRTEGWWLTATGQRLADAGQGPRAGRARVLLARNALHVASGADAVLTGIVIGSQFRGDHHLLTVQLGAGDTPAPTVVRVANRDRGAIGARIGLSVDATRLCWFADTAATGLPLSSKETIHV
jgi:iron(III) transport system ATP-binding protein